MVETLSPAAGSRPVRTFGRFELRAVLGRSAGTMTWLAFEPTQDRLVMLTMPRVQPRDAAGCSAWLQRARLAARLDHPGLARSLEIGVQDHWPFIAVERTAGITLAERLAGQAVPVPSEAADWIAQALEGLAFAHDAGIVHGDLQLHTLLIDERGAVRVMALGAALDESHPAAIERSGERAMPLDPQGLHRQREAAERDVLAAGLLLHHLLAGQPALDEPDTAAIIARLAPAGRESVRLGWSTPHAVAEALRAIVNRCTDRQPRQRYRSARSLLRALQGWLEAQAAGDGGPLALLLDRLHSVGHLPARPNMAAVLGRLMSQDSPHTGEMAADVLPDIGLSLELLRSANAPQIQGGQLAGSGPVLTVRRSIALLGLNGLRQAAGSLRAWPGPLTSTAADGLQQTMQQVQLAAQLARRLRPAGYDAEVVHLVAVLQNLGRLLVRYHFPEEAEQIRQLMQPQPAATPDAPEAPGMSEASASFAVLGTDLESIGCAVVRHWGFGDEVQLMIRRVAPDRPVRSADTSEDLLRIAASAANEAVDALALPTARMVQAVAAVAQRYARVLSITGADLTEALQAARRDAAATGGAEMVDEVEPAHPDDRPGRA